MKLRTFRKSTTDINIEIQRRYKLREQAAGYQDFIHGRKEPVDVPIWLWPASLLTDDGKPLEAFDRKSTMCARHKGYLKAQDEFDFHPIAQAIAQVDPNDETNRHEVVQVDPNAETNRYEVVA